MSTDDPNKDKRPSASSSEDENNPFIAFRRHVDHHLESFFSSIINLPSTIYSQGGQHARGVLDMRRDGTGKLPGSTSKDGVPHDSSKDWERAMKDFEQEEVEAKEWYETILKQITASRDAHLESGFAVDDQRKKEAPADAEELSCPYLPLKEFRTNQHQEAGERKEGYREWLRDQRSHSRFLDWVWSGWGGPSTTSEMLWHHGGQQKEPEVPKELLQDVIPKPPALSPEDNSEPHVPQTATDMFRFAEWLVTDDASPVNLEDDPVTAEFGGLWRAAFEDLLRVERNEPLTELEELGDNLSLPRWAWILRTAQMHGNNEQFKKATDLAERAFGRLSELGLLGLDKSTENQESEATAGPWDQLMKGFFEQPEPETELDMYERHFGGRSHPSPAIPPWTLPETQNPSILSTLTKTKRVTNPDGTVTEKTVLKESFANGHEKVTETMKTTDKNGTTKSETSSTTTGSQIYSFVPFPAQTSSPWDSLTSGAKPQDWSGEYSPVAPTRALEQQSGALQDNKSEAKRKMSGGGWFWKS